MHAGTQEADEQFPAAGQKNGLLIVGARIVDRSSNLITLPFRRAYRLMIGVMAISPVTLAAFEE